MIKRNRKRKIPSINMLSAGTEIRGDVNVTNDFRIDGAVYGDIICKGKLTIGKTAYIEGQINCESAEISGIIKGDIKSTGLVVLREDSSFTGNIDTAKIMIEFGTKIAMTCKTTEVTSDNKQSTDSASEKILSPFTSDGKGALSSG